MAIANPWRGEVVLVCAGEEVTLRCRMDVLATILDVLDCENLIEVFRKWDGMDPDVMKNTLQLLAESPTVADEFWPKVNGLKGLEAMQIKFYEVVSGRNPDEIAEEEENRKKLQNFLAEQSDEQVAKIVEAMNL